MLEYFPQVLDMPIKDCKENMIDIRCERKINYHPVLDKNPEYKTMTRMRKTIYQKLLEVQDRLYKSHGYRIRLLGGHRSIKTQVAFFKQYYEKNKKEFPKATEQELFDKTKKFVSPIDLPDGRRNVPPHSTGAAVDVELVDREGKTVDMGMDILNWQKVDKDLCKSECTKISKKAQENRKVMADAFFKSGFVGHPTEFWHFSYGDRLWAVKENKPCAIYDSTE